MGDSFFEEVNCRKEENNRIASRYYQTSRNHFDPELVIYQLKQLDAPALIAVDPYVLSKQYSVFPQEHDYHYLVASGIEQEKIRIIDNYFGFVAPMELSLLESAILSTDITHAREYLRIDCSSKQDTLLMKEDINAHFQKLVQQYCDGYTVINNKRYLYGLPAIQAVNQQLEGIYEYYRREGASEIDALSYMIRRINVLLTNERESILEYCRRYGGNMIEKEYYTPLVTLLEQSTNILKGNAYKIQKGILKKEPISQIMQRIKGSFSELLTIESHLYELLINLNKIMG